MFPRSIDAYCIIYHRRDALKFGVAERKIHLLNAWQETSEFSQRERAALAWAEAVTLISVHHLPDEVYAEAARVFSEQELVDLNLAVMSINYGTDCRSLSGINLSPNKKNEPAKIKCYEDRRTHCGLKALQQTPSLQLKRLTGTSQHTSEAPLRHSGAPETLSSSLVVTPL